MNNKNIDFTTGNLWKEIIVFTIPLLVGQIFQNLYNSVDALVVGNFVGMTALAAVTSCSDIAHFITGFFTGLSTGTGVLFSQYYGAKNYKGLHDVLHTSVLFSIILGFSIAVISIICTPALLMLVDCPPDVYAGASAYLRIYLIGVLFTSIYNICSGILRAVGDSKTPFYVLVVASVMNIILDLLFVGYFKLGAVGVAFATIISQLTSVLLVWRKLTQADGVIRIVIRELKIDKKVLMGVLNLGLPAAIQASLTSVANLFIQKYINGFGSVTMAGIGVAKKIDKFVALTAQSVGLATTTVVSQNAGGGDDKRARDGIKISLVLAIASVAAVGIPVYIFAPVVSRVFTEDEGAIQVAVAMVKTIVPFYIFTVLNHVMSGATRGYGKSKAVMLLSLLGMVGVRQIYLAISMHVNRSVYHIFYSYPVGWGAAGILVLLFYLWVIRKKTIREKREV